MRCAAKGPASNRSRQQRQLASESLGLSHVEGGATNCPEFLPLRVWSSRTIRAVRRIGSAVEGAESFPHVPQQKNSLWHTRHAALGIGRIPLHVPWCFRNVDPLCEHATSPRPFSAPDWHACRRFITIGCFERKRPHRATSRCEGGRRLGSSSFLLGGEDGAMLVAFVFFISLFLCVVLLHGAPTAGSGFRLEFLRLLAHHIICMHVGPKTCTSGRICRGDNQRGVVSYHQHRITSTRVPGSQCIVLSTFLDPRQGREWPQRLPGALTRRRR
jgi:hypothetical protein